MTAPASGNTVYLLIPFGSSVESELFVTDALRETLVFKSPAVPILPRAGYVPPEGKVTLDKTELALMDRVYATIEIAGGTPPYTPVLGYPLAWAWEPGFDAIKVLVRQEGERTFSAPSPGKGKLLRMDFRYIDGDDRLIEFSAPHVNLLGTQSSLYRDISVLVNPANPSPLAPFDFTITPNDNRPLGTYDYQLTLYRDGYAPEVLDSGTSSSATYVVPPNSQAGEYEFGTVFPAGQTLELKQRFSSGRVRVAMPPLPGDANLSGTVDIADLASIIDQLLGKGYCPSTANANADGQGTIDLNDLLWIIRSIVQ